MAQFAHAHLAPSLDFTMRTVIEQQTPSESNKHCQRISHRATSTVSEFDIEQQAQLAHAHLAPSLDFRMRSDGSQNRRGTYLHKQDVLDKHNTVIENKHNTILKDIFLFQIGQDKQIKHARQIDILLTDVLNILQYTCYTRAHRRSLRALQY
jgi:hypothetical protein